MAKNATTNKLSNIAPETSSQRILLAEYRLLQERFERNRDQGIARINFFITATSVILGSVLVLGSGSNIPLFYFKLILLVALIVLSILGLDIYIWLIQRDISADRYERGLARIRHYFIMLDQNIEGYFVMNVVDAPTNHLIRKLSSVRSAAQIVESFLISLAITVLFTFMSFSPEESITTGCISMILVFIILEASARMRLSNALKRAKANVSFKTKEGFDG